MRYLFGLGLGVVGLLVVLASWSLQAELAMAGGAFVFLAGLGLAHTGPDGASSKKARP